ncbi:MAG TPA: 16S rRNA (cytosine(1402)-N(4))-methyltransferase RsmH [Candidatus Hydrogenedentes bacterium]|nr:16S rRNA (cytosine(1402)-N(4))-methyltransferase RsmH [Candidatus Hydrogenedentota bacterium]HOL76014.1 16S rRNA (cytosine(1402)-N(4))-methyltransferase RsmH [Candidatus Hydrogenedentota bacterium]HPO84628.1 16S rRNA (cytosine(1402)-N(4))-methyltransferase RsmH [Candidatus Hydrogenedentota bacterium]
MTQTGPVVSGHVPVLAEEVLHWLRVREDGVYVDGTVGAGGHAALIAQRAPRGKLVALDRDPEAVLVARRRLQIFPHVTVLHANYGNLEEILREQGITQVDGVLIDAGVSSMQLDDPRRGFSFQSEGPLDMRMDTDQELSARTYLEHVSLEELTQILRTYGDVRPAHRIARTILDWREQGNLQTTSDLAAAVQQALGVKKKQPEEVRVVFQAIRIAVNEEYRCLESGLHQAIHLLAAGGRIVAISFHSGEDRIVKNVLKQYAVPRRFYYPDGRLQEEVPPLLKILTPHPVRPSQEEQRRNPRAKSARLRAAEKLPEEEGP